MISGRCHFLHEWPDWDFEIHNDDAQISRQGRAMTYPFTFEIDPASKTAKFSSTSILPYYSTTLSICNCYDFQNRKLPCKHIYRLARELGIIEIIKRTRSKTDLDTIRNLEDIDSHPDQIKRIERSRSRQCKPVSVDFIEQTAEFKGSGGNYYHTTVDACTCRDYTIRRLPCKHIYRLRYELAKATKNG